ncbi:SdrD B-like domain-containing protein [Octadecabacter sp. 1_MG-2023]|uniref:DUF7507 domain-containing protein n=1 Tax=Octadecabacter sp. 1_MG-2023 TaxID=3062636 RepID=UPI0026E1D388|nr:SdrD B-like domain-containing protein [Octadecabacter sp. 1_MG-2023]MDO6735643.1 SdrD B-like domain-containing protein [Octadecabacter sp. 1_MG-2023]
MSDASDEATPGSTDNDPTSVPLAAGPDLSVVKGVTNIGALQADGSFEVTYQLVTTNTGNVTLDNLTLVDDLNSQFGAGAVLSVVTQPTVTVQPTLAGHVEVADTATTYAGGATALIGATGTLPVGDSFTVTFTVNLDASASTSLENSATAGATPPATADTPTPSAISDSSENDATQNVNDGDPTTGDVANGPEDTSDPNDTDIPTAVTPPVDTGEIGLVKTATLNDDDGIAGASEGDTIDYVYTVTNTDSLLNAYNVSITEDPANFTGTGTLTLAPASDDNGTDLDGTGDLNDLAPGASMTFTASYTITQADVDAGKVDNQADANATDPFGNALSDASDEATPGSTDNDPTSVPLTPVPSLAAVKSITGFSDENNNGILDQGDIVEFDFIAENTGQVALANVTVDDTGLPGVSVTADPSFDGDLAIGEGPVIVATAEYSLTATDIAAGGIENTATGTGTPVASDPMTGDPIPGTPAVDSTGAPLADVTDISDTGTEPEIDAATGLPVVVTTPETTETPNIDESSIDTNLGNDPTALIIPAPAVEVVKSASAVIDTNGNGFTDEGDEVQFDFEVSNTGNTDLTSIVVSDPLPGMTITGSPIATINEGAPTDTTVTGSYFLTAADVTAGGIENTATATGTAVDENGTAYPNPFDAGQPLTVSDVSDAGTDPDGDDVTLPAITETEDLGGNTDGDLTNDPTVFLITPAPAITVVKSLAGVSDEDASGTINAGDIASYTFVVTNTGNTALGDVQVDDALVEVSGGPITLSIGGQDTTTFTAEYEITDADVLAGGIENTADVTSNAVDADGNDILDPITGDVLTATDDSDTGTTPDLDTNGDPIVQANADTTETEALDGSTDTDPGNDPTLLFIPNPELTVVKSLANVFDDNLPAPDDLFGGEGDTIAYTFTVTNTGNVDLKNVELTDPTATVAGGPIPLLAVGAGDSITFTATYTVTAADFAAGFVENTAEATGAAVDENGAPVFGPGGEELTATDRSDTGTTTDGDTVTDPASEETNTYAAATQPDGELGNDPTVVGLPGNPDPKVDIIKSVASVTDTSGDGLLGEGDTVTYSFTVTNTGNVPLGGVTVTDTIADVIGGPISLGIGDADTTTFTATTLITADQENAAAVENTATATGTGVNSVGEPLIDPVTNLQRPPATDVSDAGTEPEIKQNDGITSYADPLGNETEDASGTTDTDPTNDPTVLFLPMPEMAVVKSVDSVTDTNGNGFTDAGDVVNYTFTVENSGNTDLSNIIISDDKADSVSGNPITFIAQGDTNTGQVTATYTLLDADITAGGVENTATGDATAVGSDGEALGDPFNPGQPLTIEDTSDAGTTPDGATVGDPASTETVDLAEGTDSDLGNDPTVFLLAPSPVIELVKSITSFVDVDGDGLLEAGDNVIYDFAVTNVGNVALADVNVFDGNGAVTGGPVSLAIGETNTGTLTMTYELSQADIEAGAVENTATATGAAVTDDGTPILDPNTNAPLTTSDVSDTGTEPEVGSDGNPVAITDPESVESSDIDGSTDTDPTNDPTVLVLPAPELTLVKSTSNVLDTNGDGLFGGEDDQVTYAFTVTNTGNVDLTGVTITDATVVMAGGPIDLDVGQGDSVTFSASYIVTADDVALGYLENTAEATGNAVNADGDPFNDLNGDPITVVDTSDTGTNPDLSGVDDPAGTETPDGEGDTDGELDNDPTVTLIPANASPQIEVVKSIANVTDNGDGVIGAGDIVNYTFAVTNTGNVALADVTISDDLVSVNGAAITLALGETNTAAFTAQYTLTEADVTAGGVENTATATGNAVNSNGEPITEPNGGAQLTASDISDTGTEPEPSSTGLIETISDPSGSETPDLAGETDSDPTNDPTVLIIPSPSIEVIKSIASAPDSNGDGTFGGIGDTLFYSFKVTNTGNVDVEDIVLIDPTATVIGAPIPLLTVGGIDTSTFTATYVVTASDVNVVGYVENTATAIGTALGADGEPLGDPANPGAPISVTDTSDTGTDPVGNDVTDPSGTESPDGEDVTDTDPTNDPTVFSVPAIPSPEITLIKSVSDVFDADGDAVLGGEDDEIVYSFDVTNTGDSDLINVEVNDPLLGGLIATIPTLAILETVTITASYFVTEQNHDEGYIENQATATGTSVNSQGDVFLDPNTLEPITTTDVSDTGTDPQTDTIDDPEGSETADASGATDDDPTNDPTVVSVPLAVPDTGVSGILFFDDNDDGTFNGGDVLLEGFVVNLLDADGNIIATTVTDGNGFYSMAGFPIGDGFQVAFFDPISGEEVGSRITGLNFGRNTVLTDQNALVPPIAALGDLVLTKSTPLDTVVLGTSVPYTITVQNTSGVPVMTDLVDTLPAGLSYTTGSGEIGGIATEPSVSGTTLTWAGINVAGGATVTLELVARVGANAPTGNLTNTVNALDPATGETLAEPATATVRREAEAVFECSDIIGKVFDDRNFNGYQDPVLNNGVQLSTRQNPVAITDQTYYGGKFAGEAEPLAAPPEGEPGLSNVRLVTATGTIITTDEYGRYSVPCAALPDSTGENFTLKVDPRSLPTGYRLTTENPRTMRVTAGIATEMNFGAALGRVLDIDLTAAAFDGTTPIERLDQGLTQLLGQVVDTPSVIRISYFTNGESNQLALQRIAELEDLIDRRWRNIGRYRLIVETDILRLQ